MAKKKEISSKKPASSSPADNEKKLMEKHPFETMSQIQNRYGSGRRKNGSDGTFQDSRGSNH
ncbi:MAG TPA: hypothetical protein VGE06_03465 [Flavisolibacter sp.]